MHAHAECNLVFSVPQVDNLIPSKLRVMLVVCMWEDYPPLLMSSQWPHSLVMPWLL